MQEPPSFFSSISYPCHKLFILKFIFTVPDEAFLGPRKHDLMKCIWTFINEKHCISRNALFDYLVGLGKEVYPFEFEEFRGYVKVDKMKYELGKGYESEGGIVIKYG